MSKTIDYEIVAENIVNTMRSNPERWGSSDWNIAINLDDNSASIDHATCCYRECCGNRDVTLISLYGFNTEGWFDMEYDDDDNMIFTVIGTAAEWLESEMFSEAEISEMMGGGV